MITLEKISARVKSMGMRVTREREKPLDGRRFPVTTYVLSYYRGVPFVISKDGVSIPIVRDGSKVTAVFYRLVDVDAELDRVANLIYQQVGPISNVGDNSNPAPFNCKCGASIMDHVCKNHKRHECNLCLDDLSATYVCPYQTNRRTKCL